jgi:hypothetical protein
MSILLLDMTFRIKWLDSSFEERLLLDASTAAKKELALPPIRMHPRYLQWSKTLQQRTIWLCVHSVIHLDCWGLPHSGTNLVNIDLKPSVSRGVFSVCVHDSFHIGSSVPFCVAPERLLQKRAEGIVARDTMTGVAVPSSLYRVVITRTEANGCSVIFKLD